MGFIIARFVRVRGYGVFMTFWKRSGALSGIPLDRGVEIWYNGR